MISADRAGATLTIDLDAIAANYRLLQSFAAPAECAAVVKCDAYGLGISPIARRIAAEGCRTFFVALPDEALELRDVLAELEDPIRIYILNGLSEGVAEICDQTIAPVLNSYKEIEAWSSHCANTGQGHPAIVNFDTGISRLGLDKADTLQFMNDPGRFKSLTISYVMSHLACADEPDHSLNARQLETLKSILNALPTAPRISLANSAGIFLGKDFHFDLVRPGAALYGIGCHEDDRRKLKQVVKLKGKILQTRLIDRNMTVGYGAAGSVTRESRLATVALGYGDGFFRRLGNKGAGFLSGHRAPVVGRVSMDLVTLDVTDIPETLCGPGQTVEFIGDHQTPDDLAEIAGTIGYEVLTALGGRYRRDYIGD